MIDGQYRVVRTLGEGGMGLVLLAHDVALERDVAIKLVRPELIEVPQVREGFFAEARAMARLVHPNVVGVHAVGELNDLPYLVMDYIPGRSLGSVLTERGAALGIDEASFILDQICRGLGAIHAAGLVHRDLKPANVIIGPGFRVAIADLGISRGVGTPDPPGQPWVSGTPSYMAPEVRLGSWPGRELATRGDIYSLGVMAYQLLTGRLPYRRAPIGGLSKPTPASHVRPELPSGVDQVIEEALELFPDRRIRSADAFRRALFDALRGREPSTRRPSRILVAEDDPDYRDLTRMVLARAFPGTTVECASDGHGALRAARYKHPDLLVSDLDMPDMNGAELATTLRDRAEQPSLPIILCSAVAGATDWRLLEQLHVDGFIGKPFEPGQLVALARGVLEVKRRRPSSDPPVLRSP